MTTNNVALIEMLRGGDARFSLVYPSDTLTPLDLTGWTVSAFEPHVKLVGNLFLTIEPGTGGVITGKIEWDNTYRLGKDMTFRVQITKGQDNLSTPLFVVDVK
jgi:hypothetical protein